MAKRTRAAVLLCAVSCLVACSATREAERQVERGDLAGAQNTLEGRRATAPDSASVRIALGDTYYRRAREALDRDRDEDRYLAYLAQATDEFVAALELDPTLHQPHFYLAMIDVYRGELSTALRGFGNARRLHPSGTAHTNIAEIFVYLGRLERAYEWNDLGLRKGAPYSAYLFNEMLIAWKSGDLRGARNKFGTLKRDHPEAVQTINVAVLPEAPQTFEDFAGYCCSSPACGPYMREACASLELEVRERELSKQAVLKELRIEMERTRRLREVYEQRKELEVRIEEPPAPTEP